MDNSKGTLFPSWRAVIGALMSPTLEDGAITLIMVPQKGGIAMFAVKRPSIDGMEEMARDLLAQNNRWFMAFSMSVRGDDRHLFPLVLEGEKVLAEERVFQWYISRETTR